MDETRSQPLLHQHSGEIQDFGTVHIAERIQTLGGIAVGDPRHAAEITHIPRPPNGAEEVPAMLSRQLEAHEIILTDARDAADRAAQQGDEGTSDLLISEVVRTNELQVWFLAEHLVETPLVRAVDGGRPAAAASGRGG